VLLIEVIVGLTVFMLLVILSTSAARYPRPITTDTILFLARIGRRAEIDEKVAFRIDNERVHRMITSKRQARNFCSPNEKFSVG
jgi:hypothetical protein